MIGLRILQNKFAFCNFLWKLKKFDSNKLVCTYVPSEEWSFAETRNASLSSGGRSLDVFCQENVQRPTVLPKSLPTSSRSISMKFVWKVCPYQILRHKISKFSGKNLANNCGNKTYAFTVYQDMDFNPPDHKRVTVNSRQACMDRYLFASISCINKVFSYCSCIEEKSFICRSAVYETLTRVCKMTR